MSCSLFSHGLPALAGYYCIRLFHGHKKEARESVLVTRPTHRGSCIALGS